MTATTAQQLQTIARLWPDLHDALDTADRISRSVQRDPIQPPPPARAAVARTRGERLVWADRARRIEQARQDSADTRRRHATGSGRTAIRAALWLSGRVDGRSGPFRPRSTAWSAG
ncbi:hypothetical protein ABZ318_32955 [Streptomyces sp. NPDC006197]|uniref:hypothetical protein n=1 Tax=Streptomyces sp. NPDC006197 TaxID=3156685 RepID=UPI0033B6A623